METFDEKQLLKAISEGDEKAFKTFFLYYYPRIKGFINGLLQSQEEAEDLSQDIFLRYGTTAHLSIPSITLNLIFSAFPKCGIPAHRTRTTVQELSAERN